MSAHLRLYGLTARTRVRPVVYTFHVTIYRLYDHRVWSMAVAGTKTDNGIETQRDNRGAGVGRCAQQRAQVTRVRRLACCGSAAPACDRVRVHACCARAAVPARRSVGGRRGEPAHFADAFDLSMATSLAASSMTVLWRASRLFSELRPFHHSMNSA